MTRAKAIVLMAAGRGTRMRSKRSKVLHPVAGRPMIHYPIRTALDLGATKIVVILGHQRGEIKTYLANAFPEAPIEIAIQEQQLGTAHAVQCAARALDGFEGDVFILSGDVPALPTSVIERLDREANSADVAVLGMRVAHVAEVTRLRSCIEDSLLSLHEVSDLYALVKNRALPKPCKWSDLTGTADLSAFNVAHPLDTRVIANA